MAEGIGAPLPSSPLPDSREAVQEVLRAVRRNVPRVVFTVLVVCMLGLGLAMLWPAKFESSTTFVMRERLILSDQKLLADLKEIPLSKKLRTLESELRSRRRIGAVLDRLQWVEWLETAGHASRRRDLSRKIADNLKVSMQADTLGDHHVTLAFRWTSPHQAASFVNEMRNQWIELTQRSAATRLEEEWKRREAVVQSRRDEYQQARESLRTYDHEHNVAALLSSDDLNFQKVQLDLRLTEAQSALESSVSTRDRLEERLDTIPPEIDETILPANPLLVQQQLELAKEVAKAKGALAKAAELYTERHPTYQQAQEKLVELEAQLEAVGGPPGALGTRRVANPDFLVVQRKLQDLSTQVHESQAQVRVYTRDLAKVTNDLQQLPFIEHDRAELRLAVSTSTALLQEAEMSVHPLRERVKEQRAASFQAGMASADRLLGGAPYEILEIGVEPEDPALPIGAVIMAMAVLLGVGLGVAFPILRELTRSSFTSPKDVTRTLGVPVLAAVDLILTGRDVRARSVQQALAVLTMVLITGALATGLYIYAFHREVLPASLLRTLRDISMFLT